MLTARIPQNQQDNKEQTMLRLCPFLLVSLLPLACMAGEFNQPGRLFHTPSERAALDQLRLGNAPDKASKEIVEQITIDGVVRRGNGKSTTWINGIPRQDNEHAQGVLVLGKPATPSGTVLQLPSGKNVNLKAGQTYDISSEKVEEGFGIPSSQTETIRSRAAKAKTPTTGRPAKLPEPTSSHQTSR